MVDVSPPSVSTAWWRMRRTFLTTTSVCGGWETSTAFRPSLCSAGRETEPSWSETAASRAATPAPWCKSPVQYLWCNRVWTFCSGSDLIWSVSVSLSGWMARWNTASSTRPAPASGSLSPTTCTAPWRSWFFTTSTPRWSNTMTRSTSRWPSPSTASRDGDPPVPPDPHRHRRPAADLVYTLGTEAAGLHVSQNHGGGD